MLKGFSQIEGIDFNETYAPVAKFVSIRVLLALGAIHDWEIHQMDVKTAFLYGELEEEVYMDQPEGYIVEGQEDLVCKLDKSLYGLKQAPRVWNDKLDSVLQGASFKRISSDFSIYIRGEGSDHVIVAVYVDDLIIEGPDLKQIAFVKELLRSNFEMKDLGEIEYCLGIQVVRDRVSKEVRLG